MLGMADGWVIAGYLLCVLSALFCVIWSAVKWNSGSEEQTTPQNGRWVEQEVKIEQDL